MCYKLYLDDVRDPNRGAAVDDEPWVIARDFAEFKKIISDRGKPEIVSLDYSLNCCDFTGMDAIKYLCENNIIESSQVFIHSTNPKGNEEMTEYLDEWSNTEQNK